MKDRKLRKEESKKESGFLPHYVFIIDEPKLIADHAIMEYLDKEPEGLGFSIIYTTHMRANLPENIKTVVQFDNSEQGVLLLEQGEMVNKKMKLQRAGQVNFETMARDLSVLVHEKGIVSQVPDSITFFSSIYMSPSGRQDAGRLPPVLYFLSLKNKFNLHIIAGTGLSQV